MGEEQLSLVISPTSLQKQSGFLRSVVYFDKFEYMEWNEKLSILFHIILLKGFEKIRIGILRLKSYVFGDLTAQNVG